MLARSPALLRGSHVSRAEARAVGLIQLRTRGRADKAGKEPKAPKDAKGTKEPKGGEQAKDKKQSAEVKESTIRLMTRLAIEHNAVNLSQGFPNEPPAPVMARAAAAALLAGESFETAESVAQRLETLQITGALGKTCERDLLSQYSYPFGLPLLRQEIQKYYERYYPTLEADAEKNVTVVLGATEGFACSLRTLCSPGDRVVFFEPFHEMYPSQCALWHLNPKSVTLREDLPNGMWRFDLAELEEALKGARVLLLNTPHNPTGKVFTKDELAAIAELCVKHDVKVVTDDIYEHIVFDTEQRVPPSIVFEEGMRERTFMVNSISKTARATGWRVGWVITPEAYTKVFRGIHDQLVLQAPTPLQYGAVHLLRLEDDYFAQIAKEYQEKRDLMVEVLRNVGFKIAARPRGAYYLFADYKDVPALEGLSPTEAAMKLTTEVGVACVPGDNFYLHEKTGPKKGGRYVRFAFVRSMDLLQEAANRLNTRLVAE